MPNQEEDVSRPSASRSRRSTPPWPFTLSSAWSSSRHLPTSWRRSASTSSSGRSISLRMLRKRSRYGTSVDEMRSRLRIVSRCARRRYSCGRSRAPPPRDRLEFGNTRRADRSRASPTAGRRATAAGNCSNAARSAAAEEVVGAETIDVLLNARERFFGHRRVGVDRGLERADQVAGISRRLNRIEETNTVA